MKRDPNVIAKEIINLVSELAACAGVTTIDNPSLRKNPTSAKKDNSGATGGIRILVDDGNLDSPKQLSEIMDLLKREGRHYGKPTVSMGLLSLVRERLLTRFRDKGEKNWKYAVRR